MDNVSESISRIWNMNRRSVRWSALAIRTGLILFLLSAFISRPVLSQVENPQAPAVAMPTWTKQVVDGPRYFVDMTDRSLAFKPDGTACAAYGGDALYYACFNTVTKTWSSTVLDSGPYVGQYAALKFYKVPTLVTEAFISYYDALNGQLKFMYTIGGAWQAPIVVPNPAPGTLVEEPHVPSVLDAGSATQTPEEQTSPQDESAWRDAPWLNNASKNDPNFPILDPRGVGKHTSIAVDIRGVYISYYDDREVIINPGDPCGTPNHICERNLKVAHWDFSNPWEFWLVDDHHDQGRVGLWSSIVLDYMGNMHIAYMDEKYDKLKYAFWNRSKPDWVVPDDGVDGVYPATLGSMCSIALEDIGGIGIPGKPVISYLDFGGGKLKIARLTDLSSNTWAKKVIDAEDNTGWWTSIAVDGDKKIYISYYNATDGDLKFASGKFNGTWSIKTIRPKIYGEGLYSSLALNPADGHPAIVHYNKTLGRLEHSREVSKTDWDTVAVDYGADVGYASSLKITSFGQPNIAYLNVTAGNMKYALPGIVPSTWYNYYPVFGPNLGLFNSLDLYNGSLPRVATYVTKGGDAAFGKSSGTGWQFEYIDRTYDVGQYISLGVDSTDKPHVSYYDATHGNLVYATKISATEWVTSPLDIIGDVGMFTSLAISTDDRVYISYFDYTNTRLKIIYQTPPFKFWIDPPQVVDSGGVDDVGLYSSIALDGSGNPNISYYDESNKKLKFAYYDGTWHPETVADPDTDHDVGRFTSLAIDPATNTRHICYFDLTSGALKYARYIPPLGPWEFAVVDDVGDTGYSCSIDLNSLGQPAISYYDNSNANLKIALSFTVPVLPYMLFLPIIER
jgi:hypothetical protein